MSTTPVSGEAGSVNIATIEAGLDPVSLVNDILKALETPGTSAETVTTFIAEGLAAIGLVVGAFDHPLGLAISTVPQATILAASTVAAAGLTAVRLLAKSRKQVAAAQMASEVHHTQATSGVLPAIPHAA